MAALSVGQQCRLDVSASDAHHAQGGEVRDGITVLGVLIGQRRHAEDAGRLLWYLRATHVSHSAAKGSSPLPAAGAVSTRHRSNDVIATPRGFTSTDGYTYRFDGWYDGVFLYPLSDEEAAAHLSPEARPAARQIAPEWLQAMSQAPAACEVRLLCYALRPWFPSPFTALGYLPLPERDVCYSVWLCHRCMSPFFSQLQLAAHLQGYCAMWDPPGTVIYADERSGAEVRYVDGAQHLHYARCLSLVGRCFIESKLLANDVDIYEWFVLTVPRRTLPYIPGEAFAGERDFREVAAHFDEAGWSGRVVAGYFSRRKHARHHTLSCIMTLPMFQRQRLGALLLDVAYALTAERQLQCGCRQLCGAPERDGGAISKPFSPHGQQLLLRYWRHALVRALWRRRDAADGGLDFGSVKELAAAFDIPIAACDLEFLLHHCGCAFYAPLEAAAAATTSTTTTTTTTAAAVAAETGGGGGGQGSAAAPRYQLSLLFDREEAAAMMAAEGAAAAATLSPPAHNGNGSDRRGAAVSGTAYTFRRECLCRSSNGKLVYRRSMFHY